MLRTQKHWQMRYLRPSRWLLTCVLPPFSFPQQVVPFRLPSCACVHFQRQFLALLLPQFSQSIVGVPILSHVELRATCLLPFLKTLAFSVVQICSMQFHSFRFVRRSIKSISFAYFLPTWKCFRQFPTAHFSFVANEIFYFRHIASRVEHALELERNQLMKV